MQGGNGFKEDESPETRARLGEESPSTSIGFWLLTHSNVTQEKQPNLNRSKIKDKIFLYRIIL